MATGGVSHWADPIAFTSIAFAEREAGVGSNSNSNTVSSVPPSTSSGVKAVRLQGPLKRSASASRACGGQRKGRTLIA